MGIAETILEQLGGRRFAVMTGANHFVSGDNSLSFKIPISKGINCVKITLTPSDLYDIEFGRLVLSSCEYTVKHVAKDIYCDMLEEIFTSYTGLYTRF